MSTKRQDLRNLYIELTKFTLIGFACVGIDLVMYYFTSQFTLSWVAKTLGFLSGTVANYNLNKYWTWKQKDKSQKRLARYLALYGTSMLVNVLANEWFLGVIPNHEFMVQFRDSGGNIIPLLAFKFDKIMAFILATGVSTVLNFVGQKLWVFNSSK